MQNKIYTIGYQSLKKIDNLVELTRDKQAFLVDIRYRPWSKEEQWQSDHIQQAFLKAGLPATYWWVRELGNVNYNGDAGIKLWNADKGIEEIKRFLEQRSVILMCCCWDVLTCHRLLVANLLTERLGVEVEHLLAVPKSALSKSGELPPALAAAPWERALPLRPASISVDRYLRKIKAPVLPGFESI
jgi:uncharacterized protein (DUF488 family)